jgi:restriction system protein
MARRRDDNLFALLGELPWWVSIIVGGVVYLALKYLAVGFSDNNMFLSPIAKALQPNAGLFASFFLLPAAISFFKSIHRRKLLDGQSGLDSIRAMSWREFEMLCGEAFRRKGYAVEENGLGGADGGIDLILRKNGETSLVQCKRWKTAKVGVREVRELYGIVAAERADSGVFITSGSYTAEARVFAKGKPLDLIDGSALRDLVRTVQKDQLPRAPKQEPRPARLELETPSSPICPRCGSSMVLRTARRGSVAGNQFWGCSNFPKCRAVLEAS